MPKVSFSRTLLCSPGLGAEASTSRKPSASRKGKLMVFRVCGNKGIACTVAFVYTQALLASNNLNKNCIYIFVNFRGTILL